MSKLKVDELRSADRSVSSTANITLADDGSTTIPNGTLSAGTIGSGVEFPQTGYAQLNLTSQQTSQGEITWATITGDTTNITKSNTDVTLVLAGVYLIQLNLSISNNSSAERYAQAAIRLSSDDSVLAYSYGGHGFHDSNTTYGQVTASTVRSFSTNTAINFFFNSGSQGNSFIHPASHASIVLIKPA